MVFAYSSSTSYSRGLSCCTMSNEPFHQDSSIITYENANFYLVITLLSKLDVQPPQVWGYLAMVRD